MRFFNWLRATKSTPIRRRNVRRRSLQCLSRLELFECRELLTATLFDLNVGPGESNPANLTNVNGTLYFTTNFDRGKLWRSEGTPQSTTLVKEFSGFEIANDFANFTNVGGTLFFTVMSYSDGTELWTSDGTPDGTFMVRDIRTGGGSSFPADLTNVGGTLYFTADDGVHGRELWRSNGTGEGTMMIRDFIVWAPPWITPSPHELTDVNGTLYFTAPDGGGIIHDLWKSDGTEEGTLLVKSIDSDGGGIGNLTIANGTLFFNAVVNSFVGSQLWKSDGTTEGTVFVGGGTAPSNLTNVNGTIFYSANGASGRELWKTDGFAAGTMVKDLNPNVGTFGDAFGSNPEALINVNGTLYFRTQDIPGIGSELWKSDGTPDGTVPVKDIWPGFYSSTPDLLTNVNGTLFFTAWTPESGREVWQSDGTETGTFLVQDVVQQTYPFDFGRLPDLLTDVDGILFFTAGVGLNGREVWRVTLGQDAAQTFEAKPVQIDVLTNDLLAPGATITAISTPAHGSAVLNDSGTITYTPAAGYYGVDTFTYSVPSAAGIVEIARVSVTVVRPKVIDVTPARDLRSLILQLNNDDLDSARATNVANYRLTAAHGDANRDGNPFNDGDEQALPITAVDYDAVNDRLTVHPQSILLGDYFRLVLDGDNAATDGSPGIADFSGSLLVGGDHATVVDLRNLSGNVTLMLKSGDLVVTGDDADSEITMDQSGSGQVHISGAFRYQRGTLPFVTTINGGVDPVLIAGTTRDLQIDLKGGNDLATLTGTVVPRQLRIDGGDGDNNVFIDSATVRGDLSVKNIARSGGLAGISRSTIGHDMTIDNKAGSGAALFLDTMAIGGTVTVRNGDGNSSTSIYYAAIGRDLSVESKSGYHSFDLVGTSVDGSVIHRSGDGDVSTNIYSSTIGRDLTVDSRAGYDSFSLVGSSVDGNVTIRSGDGGSSFWLIDSRIGRALQIANGRGNDFVILEMLTVGGKTNIDTGRDDDYVEIRGSTFLDDVGLMGGIGRDTWVDALDNVFSGRLSLKDFE